MKKILYTLLFTASLVACNNKDIIKGTAVSFYPDLVDAVAEGGSSSATLELTGPGQGIVTIKVSDPEFVTTTPAMVDGTIEIVFAGEDSQTIAIEVARGGRSEDYVVDFSVVSVSGDIRDIAKGTFSLYVSAIPSLALPFSDDFESCSAEYETPGQWTEVFEDGSKTDRGWGCRANDGVDGSTCVRASAYGGETGTDLAWLITKGSLDLTTVSEAYMTFDIKSNFSGDGELFVKWSEDYSGTGDPTQATWEEVPGVSSQLPAQGTGVYKKVAAELNSLVGKKVFIGFQYTGGTNLSSASYEMDNFLVSEDGSGFENFLLPFSDNLDNCSDFSIPENFTQVRTDGSKQDRGWECSSNGTSGTQAVTASGLGGVDGSVDAWLISAKAFDLASVATGTLSFEIKSRDAGSGMLKVLWSEDYSGSGSTSTAAWTALNDFTAPVGGSNAFETAELDLTDATGKTVYIAFQFVGATNASSVSYDIDDINVTSDTGSSGSSGSGGDITDAGDCDLTGSGTVIISHDFEGCTTDYEIPSGFIEVNLPGTKTDRGWGCRADGTDGSRGVRASAYGGDDGEDNAWLIMYAIDVSSYSEVSITFDVTSIFDGPGDLFVLYSNDYSGSGDPTGATWAELENVSGQLPATGSNTFATVTTAPCDMSGSSVYIAFQYVNGTSASSSSWSIDNLEVRGN